MFKWMVAPAMSANASGAMFMLTAMFSLATMDALAKYLVKDSYDPLQILAIRSWLILCLLLCYYFTRGTLHKLKTGKVKAQILRGLCGCVAPYCFFMSLKTLPLADATVIFFSSTFMITALSGPLLKEKVGLYRWSAVIVGFLGVLIAMNPSGEGALLSYLYCLTGSFSYALLFLSGRWLSRTESVDSIVFYFNLCMAVVASLLAPLVWLPVPTSDYSAIALFSVLAMLGHICIANAFSRADVGFIAPLEYTALIWSVLWGYVIWTEVPEPHVMLGGAIIITCALVVIYRETRTKTHAGSVVEP
ncbi:MAG: DMT family transporter [Pseudomonadales bacterium]